MNRFRVIARLAVITLAFLSARATLCVPAAAAPPGHPPGAKRGRTVEEAAGSVAGSVCDADRTPAANVCVVLCDAASGIPLSSQTMRPFTEEFLQGRQTMDLAFAVTDDSGHFRLGEVPPGRYRLISQRWKDADPVEGLLDVNGKEIELFGVAKQVEVAAGGTAEVTLRPAGTGTLRIDLDAPNNDMLLVLSTQTPRADAILGFAGWGGAFLENMFAGNRMPAGETTIHGLAEGKVHLAVFANDNSPGFGAAQATIRPGATTVAYVPLVAGWSDAHHDPPDRLRALYEEVKLLTSTDGFSMSKFLKSNGIEIEPQGGFTARQQAVARHLERKLTLPSGTETTYADFAAAGGYVELQRMIARRKERAKKHRESEAAAATADSTAKTDYEKAFVALYRELGSRYPCFEIKGIDWAAVGEEMLPRAKGVETDEQFGLLCTELVARLQDSHAHVGAGSKKPPVPPYPAWDPGLACLIDSRCISAGEGWASWFVANGRARSFGETTAGASSRKTTYTLPGGLYRVTFPVKAYRGFLDRPIERRGLEPDVRVRQTASDLAAGRDTVLEAARRYLLEAAR